MQNIRNILKEKKATHAPLAKQRKRNITWEEADVMGKYVELSTPFIMSLFKKFGKNKVLNCQSYLKDFNGNCSLEQALVYRLNQT